MALVALCIVHISAIRAQFCTNEKTQPGALARITTTNHYYLEEIGFEPQKPRATWPTPIFVHPRHRPTSPHQTKVALRAQKATPTQ